MGTAGGCAGRCKRVARGCGRRYLLERFAMGRAGRRRVEASIQRGVGVLKIIPASSVTRWRREPVGGFLQRFSPQGVRASIHSG